MPGRDGFELLAVARRESAAGVLMLTARNGVDDRLNGLRRGADDYLVKPFAMAELVARSHAILRRVGRAGSRRVVGNLLLDDDGAVVHRGEHAIALTRTERKLLDVLAEHRGTVLSKTQILNAVWGIDERADNLVEINVSSLRRKLEADGPRISRRTRFSPADIGARMSARSAVDVRRTASPPGPCGRREPLRDRCRGRSAAPTRTRRGSRCPPSGRRRRGRSDWVARRGIHRRRPCRE